MRYLQLILILLLVSCADKRAKNVDFEQSETVAANLVSDDQTDNSQTEMQNFIIKTGNYKFQVEDVEKSTKVIERLVQQHGAFIADMNLVSTSSDISNSLILRVPSKDFEKLIEDLGKEAIFTNFKRISAEDVTEEFVDIESRLKTKKEVRDRYVDILKNEAKTVEEVLKAEEQIRILQEEIEAKEGRLKFLRSRVAMSTINLEIYQRVDYKETPDTYEKPFIVKAQQGFSNGWEIVTELTILLVNIWPFIVIGLLIYWRRNWIRGKLITKK